MAHDLVYGQAGEVFVASSRTVSSDARPVAITSSLRLDVTGVSGPWRVVRTADGGARFYWGQGVSTAPRRGQQQATVSGPDGASVAAAGGCYLGVGDVARPNYNQMQAGQRTSCSGPTFITNTAQFRRSSYTGCREYSTFGTYDSNGVVTVLDNQWYIACRAEAGFYDYQLNAKAYTSNYGTSASFQSINGKRYDCGSHV